MKISTKVVSKFGTHLHQQTFYSESSKRIVNRSSLNQNFSLKKEWWKTYWIKRLFDSRLHPEEFLSLISGSNKQRIQSFFPLMSIMGLKFVTENPIPISIQFHVLPIGFLLSFSTKFFKANLLEGIKSWK